MIKKKHLVKIKESNVVTISSYVKKYIEGKHIRIEGNFYNKKGRQNRT